MTVGTASTHTLTDIGNAIRTQAGVATTYRPSAMAAAVTALDGTKAGAAGTQGYKTVADGVLSSQVFDGIAAAIRTQNGSTTRYRPAEMAPAILALSWDVGLKLRALLLADGTLEFNYRDRRLSTSGATVTDAFEVDPAGYSGSTARPWDTSKLKVTRVLVAADVTGAGIRSIAYWFHGCVNLTEVRGFENLAGVTDATQTFVSCPKLLSIYATSFDSSTITASIRMFSICPRLVGGTGSVCVNGDTAKVLHLGDGGVLTNPNADTRQWFRGHLYADGGLVLTTSPTPEAGRALVSTGGACAGASYAALDSLPWNDGRPSVTSVTIAADMRWFTKVNMNYWFHGMTALKSVVGMGNLVHACEMNYTFQSCTALPSLDLRGFSLAAPASLLFTFGDCKALTTITADATWTLPAGTTGYTTFYSCAKLVGGNGSTPGANYRNYTFMVIDKAGQVGYLTAG